MLRTLSILIVTFLSQSCGMFRVVPIQLTRVPQIEFYKQFYRPGDVSTALELADQLIGLEARSFITTRYNWSNNSFLKAFEEKKLFVTGSFTFMIYLSPSELDSFFVNAVGRYALVLTENDNKERILFTADFQVKNKGFSIDNDLKNIEEGSLPRLSVTMSQVLTRHFSAKNRKNADYLVHAVPLQFDLIMERVNGDKNLYRIKYMNGDQPEEHPVFYSYEKGGKVIQKEIGYMQFDNLRHNNLKLIDLRRRNFVHKL